MASTKMMATTTVLRACENNSRTHLGRDESRVATTPAEQLAALLSGEAGGSSATTTVSLEILRELVFHGACENSGVHSRPLAWRLLLGVLDENQARWNEQLSAKRRQYQGWKHEFLVRGHQNIVASRDPRDSSSESSAVVSHKAAHEQDVGLLKEIDKVDTSVPVP